MTTGILLLILVFAWLVLAILTFRPPDMPKLTRLLFFQAWLVVSFLLTYFFLVRVFDWNPNPLRVQIARALMFNKFIYLGDIVPGLYDLDYVHRLDTDDVEETIREEWVATYQYDVVTQQSGAQSGPFGAAIYDFDACRPPAMLSYELVPVSYDYLAQDALRLVVENAIPYADPISASQDFPEVFTNGATQGVVTDLNVFRRTGIALDCLQRRDWQALHPGEAFPNPVRYQNIGSFRGNYRIERNGATVTVVDRSPFERSQITIRRQFRPENGSYYRPGTQALLDPVEYTLAFGPGRPDQIPQVYYPEKTVLAFYLNLSQDKEQLAEANSYLSPDAQALFDIQTDQFGLAMPRNELVRVLVWQIRYEPNVTAEQLHEDRQVTVEVVGIDKAGNIDYAHPCQVTWQIVGLKNASALPYGCEWRLERYQGNCTSAR